MQVIIIVTSHINKDIFVENNKHFPEKKIESTVFDNEEENYMNSEWK